MIAVYLTQDEVKVFMNALLKEAMFDDFCLRSIKITSIAAFEINGLIPVYEDSDMPDKKEYCKWSEIKPFVFNIIKNAAKPRFMKCVFSIHDDKIQEITPEASALFLNILYENNEVLFTTGMSYKTFSMDKSPEKAWDTYISDFLHHNEINAAEKD